MLVGAVCTLIWYLPLVLAVMDDLRLLIIFDLPARSAASFKFARQYIW